MLLELRIKNYLIIDDLSVNLRNGLNILTGETGSGKSIILEAIDGLFCTRLNTDLIRVGEEKAYLEGTFSINSTVREWLLEQELDEVLESEIDENIIISREISLKGNSRVRINGILVSAKQMPELGDLLLEIHGQSSEQNLLKNKNQLYFVDEFYGALQVQLRKNYKNKYTEWFNLKSEIEKDYLLLREREKELDYLNFQFEEIKVLELEDENEEINLKKKIDKLSKAEQIKELISQITFIFNEAEDNTTAQFGKIYRQLQECTRYDETFSNYAKQVSVVQEQMTDIMSELEDYVESFDQEIEDLNMLNQRSNSIQKIRRKHGLQSLAELIKLQNELENKINNLQNLSLNLETKEKKLNSQKKELLDLAEKLSANRLLKAKELTEKINIELESLSLKAAEFKVDCQKLSDNQLNSDGLNKVEFLFRANQGDILRPLNKAVSGGELSRIMLLLKVILSTDNIIIFDEIDTGTSGKVSRLIGEKLAKLAFKQQVLCVTHQPLVAAFADFHYTVSKVHNEANTKLQFKLLQTLEEQISALVDLMSDQKDKTLAKQYIQELIISSKAQKLEMSKL
jgi:DNA repair protein RecN (Recombination protein N)